MSMEIPGADSREGRGPERKEAREAEPIRRTFEYRDAEGGLIGVAEVALGAETVEMPYAAVAEGEKAEGRKLLSFVLRGEKEGGPAEVDLLALANRHGVEVVSSDARLVNYEYSDEKKRAVVPPLETPLDVGVFLHELGHADQYHEERFGKIVPLYGPSRQASGADIKLSYGSMKSLLDAVADAVPEASVAFDDESLAQLETLEERRKEAVARKVAAEKELETREVLRNEVLGELMTEAVGRRLDLDAFVERCDALATGEGDAAPPLDASAEVQELRQALVNAGFVFLEQADTLLPVTEDDAKSERHYPSDYELPSLLLSQHRLTSAVQLREALAQAVVGPDAKEADLLYDARRGLLALRAPVRLAGGVRSSVIVRLPVDADDFERYAHARDADDGAVRMYERKVDEALKDAQDHQRAQEILMEHIDLRSIAALPTKMMERDATRRALQWLREVRRRTGADLLAKHLVPPEALVAVGIAPAPAGCVGSTAEGMGGSGDEGVEATVLADLKNALATYGADTLRIHPPDDEGGIGITPVAGLDRTKKPPGS